MAAQIQAPNPTLQSVLMVEETIEQSSGEYTKYQLWKKLPRKMMYQTFSAILDYLEHANKIITARDGRIVWIWNPGLVRRLEREGLFDMAQTQPITPALS